MAKTLIERFGFADPDRKTPLHDRICLWVHANGEKVMADALGLHVVNRCLEIQCQEFQRFGEALGLPIKPKYAGVEVTSEWEAPIHQWFQNGSKQMVGFIDVGLRRSVRIETGLTESVVFECKEISFDGIRQQLEAGLHPAEIDWGEKYQHLKSLWVRAWENNIPTSSIHPVQKISTNERLCVEVKSKIDSLGDLLRQIQFYRSFCHGPWCVVSPDTRHADLIRQQGIHFVEYPRHLVNQTGQADLF